MNEKIRLFNPVLKPTEIWNKDAVTISAREAKLQKIELLHAIRNSRRARFVRWIEQFF